MLGEHKKCIVKTETINDIGSFELKQNHSILHSKHLILFWFLISIDFNNVCNNFSKKENLIVVIWIKFPKLAISKTFLVVIVWCVKVCEPVELKSRHSFTVWILHLFSSQCLPWQKPNEHHSVWFEFTFIYLQKKKTCE